MEPEPDDQPERVGDGQFRDTNANETPDKKETQSNIARALSSWMSQESDDEHAEHMRQWHEFRTRKLRQQREKMDREDKAHRQFVEEERRRLKAEDAERTQFLFGRALGSSKLFELARRSSSAPRSMLLAPPPTSLERICTGTKDVSCAKAKTIMRNVIRDSEGNDIPTDTAKVKLSVESASEGAAPLAGFTPNDSEFSAGSGEV